MKSYETVKLYFPVILIEPVYQRKSNFTIINRLITNPLNILINNLKCEKFFKMGYQVFSDSDCGTIKYVQPMAENVHPSIFDLFVWRLNRLIDVVSRLGRSNLRLIIYNSRFTSVKFGRPNKNTSVRILYPGILDDKIDLNSISLKENIILTISRISPEKNFEALYQIVSGIGFKHYLIGYCNDFKYLESLKKSIPESIVIPNATEDQKTDLLKRAKILLHTAINEPAGMVY
ncbi:MAG: glycosyltransferase, partial [Thermoplasmatales archaeon]